MCGRYALSDSVNRDITEFVASTGRKPEEWAPDWEARWNIKPTNRVPVLVDSPKDRQLRFERAHWSLIPPWSDSRRLKFPTFNARSESVTEKATWKKPVKSTRAIIPASGYFEWTGEKGSKQPWWIHPDGGTLGLAGLYSWWADREMAEDDPDRWVLTATILTMPTVEPLAEIHDRNPMPLPESMWEQWLDPTIVGDRDLVDEAVHAARAEAEQLAFHKVAPFKLNDDGPQLIAPA